jgi:transcription elongation factor Elf1
MNTTTTHYTGTNMATTFCNGRSVRFSVISRTDNRAAVTCKRCIKKLEKVAA